MGLFLLLFGSQHCSNPRINQASDLRLCQHFHYSETCQNQIRNKKGVVWWNATNQEDVRKDQRSEVKEEGLNFTQGT